MKFYSFCDMRLTSIWVSFSQVYCWPLDMNVTLVLCYHVGSNAKFKSTRLVFLEMEHAVRSTISLYALVLPKEIPTLPVAKAIYCRMLVRLIIQLTYNVTLWCFRLTIVAEDTQQCIMYVLLNYRPL
jgi:hypothetical protein